MSNLLCPAGRTISQPSGRIGGDRWYQTLYARKGTIACGVGGGGNGGDDIVVAKNSRYRLPAGSGTDAIAVITPDVPGMYNVFIDTYKYDPANPNTFEVGTTSFYFTVTNSFLISIIDNQAIQMFSSDSFQIGVSGGQVEITATLEAVLRRGVIVVRVMTPEGSSDLQIAFPLQVV